MAPVNVPHSRDNSLSPPPPERNITGKGAQRKTSQGRTAKNLPSLFANNRTADQAFHDAPSELAPDSQLQNKIANLERPRPTLHYPQNNPPQTQGKLGTRTLGCFMSMKYLLVPRPPETPTLVITGPAMHAILHPPQQRYASSRTPRKIVPATAGSSINVPTAQATTQNVVIPSDPPQQVPTMPAQLQRDKDNSNPSTLWNLSRSLSFIR